ncbi:MAG: DUF5683 domain-containing protein [Bacteroidia bacterium]|nr:DUF5683 domain-containing protein [Bacteroidia bacterium]
MAYAGVFVWLILISGEKKPQLLQQGARTPAVPRLAKGLKLSEPQQRKGLWVLTAFSWKAPLCLRDSAPDTVWLPNPRLSAILSALIPGAGQIYNRSYWKAPIVWAALGITGYGAYQNHQQYLFYRRAYREALQGRNPLPSLRPENIRFLRESYRQDRDVFLLAFLIAYGLQVGEAYADAHLKGFTIYAVVVPMGVSLAFAW